MKKIFFLTMTACMFILGSCTQDEGALGIVSDEETTEVTICTDLATATKAALNPGSQFSGLDNVDGDTYEVRYQLGIWRNDVQVRETMTNLEPITANPSTTSFKVTLARGQEYQFVIWADFVEKGTQGADLHYITTDGLKNIVMKTGSEYGMNDESKDAYFVSEKRTVSGTSGGATISLTLKRPLAKIRFIATDYIADELADITELQSYYSTPSTIYTNFNALTGAVTGGVTKPVDIGLTDKRDCTPVFHPDTKQAELFWDYLFVPENDAVRITFGIAYRPNSTANAITKSYSNVALVVKQNYMTTVRSTLFTAEQNLNVTIDDEFEDYIALTEGRAFIGDAVYPTIAAAMNDAVDGDVIRLVEGYFNEDVTVEEGVTLQGEGKTTILTGYIYLKERSTLKDLRSYYLGKNTSGASTRTAAYVAGPDVTIDGVTFDTPANEADRHFIPKPGKGQKENEAILTIPGATGLTFTGNTINEPYWKGIYMNNCSGYVVTGNTFNNLNPFSVDNFSPMTITGNTFIRSGLSNTRMIHFSGLGTYTKDIVTEWPTELLALVKEVKMANTWEDATSTTTRRHAVRVSNFCIGGPGDDPTGWIWYTP